MDNRTRLVAEALRLFAERGYDAVGVQEIVEAAGLTKPTLYHYFGNKLGLLQALVARHGAPIAAGLERSAHYQGDLPLALERLVTEAFAHARGDRDYARLRLALWFAPPDSEAGRIVTAQLAGELAQIEALFEAATRDHGNMRGRAARYAFSLQGLVHAHIGWFLRGQLVLDAALARQVVHQFMHGIYS